MDLIVWRHAQAEDMPPAGDDLARALTAKGQQQAARMAAWINRHVPKDATIWVSPARRTQQTAQALGRTFKTSAAIGPGASVAQLLDVARWPGNAGNCVVLVGHQPTLGQTVAQLLGLRAGACSVQKGALWWLRGREHDGHNETILRTVQTPELLLPGP